MKLLFISLGCDKNLVDSEEMLGMLAADGHEIVDDEDEAEVIIVNTCCFIGDAKEESVNTILEMAEKKKAGTCKVLIVTGCMAQRYKKEISEEIPEVDAILGTTSYGDISKAVKEAQAGRHFEEYKSIDFLPDISGKRMLTTGGHFAYLKIAEGCDKHCTYCIIPRLRGGYRSVPMEQLVKEARSLAEKGVKELILVAQETTVYGKDIYGKKSLHVLLKELCKIKGIRWIRILYCYPEEIYDELIQTMKEEKKICHYLDLPIQHASDRVLKRMGRRTTKQELVDIIGRLRREIPDIFLRTTLISGFPGETQEDHEELMEFVDEIEFDRLGVFPYSAEEDTPAATMEDQIPEEVKEARRDEIMELQQEISLEKGESRVGQVLTVMIEGKVSGESAYIGRTYGDAPKVDGYIFVQTGELLMTGDFARVRVTGALEYDLIGELNTPNKLTIARMILVPFFVLFILTGWGGDANRYICLAIFVVASITDWFDGHLARKNNLVTNFGKFMDPLADKLLVCSALICMIELDRLPAWFVIIIIAREFIISGFRLIAAENGVVIAANYWGKFKTVSQMVMIILLILNFGGAFEILTQIFVWASLALTVISLITYIVQNKNVISMQE